MFEAIRSKLVGAWRDLRERGLVTLFFFELVVVTLGVLLAQGIADWADERAEDRRLEASLQRVRLDMQDAMWTAQVYRDQKPCFDGWMTHVMRAASSGERLEEEWLTRPGMRVASVHELDGGQFERLGERDGTTAAESLRDMTIQTAILRERSGEIAEAWEAFALLDPANGRPAAEDRAAVRRAAARIKTLFSGIAINSENIVNAGHALGVTPSNHGRFRASQTCQEIRDRDVMVVTLNENTQ